MCTVFMGPETLPAEKRSREDSQKAVDRLMEYDRKSSADPNSCEPPFFKDHPYGITSAPLGGWGRGSKCDIYVWLSKGFYYVRYQLSILAWGTTAYAYPILVVEKSKLRPDQVEYMDRKRQETLEAVKQYQKKMEE